MKPKILVVFHSANIQSGATRSLTDIMNHLISTKKYDIEVVFPDCAGSAIDYYKNKNICVHTFQYGKLMQDLTQSHLKRAIKFPFLCFRYLCMKNEARRTAKELKNQNIDMVYSNTSSVVFGGWLGLNLGCKQIWHIREFRVKDHQIEFFLGEDYLKRFINKCADAVLFVSRSVMDDHVDLIDKNKMAVTYNSYPESFIMPRDRFNMSRKLCVLIAGDIKPSKGQLDVVMAVESLLSRHANCDIELHLAGRKSNSDYYEKIVQFTKEKQLSDRVILHGLVNDMASLRSQMDVGVIASTNEAFGRTTIEGMLSMMAMIGRNSGGTTEQIKDCETGLLYDGTVEDLADKIFCLYKNRSDMKRYAQAGFENSVELHTKGRCAQIAEIAIDRVVLNQ
ncbi:glycosyltransferase family 4 protein [Desulfosporosinus fructosivorans]|nr:glycosyltransferase family 4 protein [Desulfosporosinus fructosivorans]